MIDFDNTPGYDVTDTTPDEYGITEQQYADIDAAYGVIAGETPDLTPATGTPKQDLTTGLPMYRVSYTRVNERKVEIVTVNDLAYLRNSTHLGVRVHSAKRWMPGQVGDIFNAAGKEADEYSLVRIVDVDMFHNWVTFRNVERGQDAADRTMTFQEFAKSYRKATAKERRWVGIGDVSRVWFDQAERTEVPENFHRLAAEIMKLRHLGQTEAWMDGLTKWLATVHQAQQSFAVDNEATGDHDDDYYGPATRKEFQRWFHWALFQGSNNAYIQI